MNLNKVILIGRAGDTPELKSLSTNTSVATFSLATSRKWTDKQGSKKEETEWHRVVLWAKLAEVAASFIIKGSLVMIEGRLQTRSWEDKQGNKRQTTEVIGESLQLGPKPQNTTSPARSHAGQDEEVLPEDIMPF